MKTKRDHAQQFMNKKKWVLIGVVFFLFFGLGMNADGQITQKKTKGDINPLLGKLIFVSVDKVRYNPGGTINITYNCSRCGGPCDRPYTDEVFLHPSNIGVDQMGLWTILGSLQPGVTRGSLSFRIPRDIRTAMNYVVTIWNSNRCWGRSSVFQIVTPPRVLLHQVTRPRPREVIFFGTQIPVRWIMQNGWSERVGVLLFKPGDSTEDHLASTSGNRYNWLVGRGSTLHDGDNYRIKIKDASNSSRVISSGPFTLRTPAFSIRVTNATTPGASIRRGNNIRVRWTTDPALPAGTRYVLYIKWDRISTSIPASSHRMMRTTRRDVTWMIPRDYAPGTPAGFPRRDAGRFTCQVEVRLDGIEYARGVSHRFDIE